MAGDAGMHTTFTPNEWPLIIDTGASITITSNLLNFKEKPRPVLPIRLQGIVYGLELEEIGTATYWFKMDTNMVVTIQLQNVLYVPGYPIHLLCPRCVTDCSGLSKDGFNSQRDNGILTIHCQIITVPYQQTTGLPCIFKVPGLSLFQAFNALFSPGSHGDFGER
jgi:hypothetical protein